MWADLHANLFNIKPEVVVVYVVLGHAAVECGEDEPGRHWFARLSPQDPHQLDVVGERGPKQQSVNGLRDTRSGHYIKR